MPTYDYKCKCGATKEVMCSIKEYEKIRDTIRCYTCNELMLRIIGQNMYFTRDSFKPEYWEHVADKPMFIRDMHHLKDVCQEHGNYSRLVEDGR